MCIYVKHIGEFAIFKAGAGDYIIRNVKAWERHAHLKRLSTCETLIRMVTKKIVPDNDFLKESAFRISRDRKYRERLSAKMDERPQCYINRKGGGGYRYGT